MSFRLFFFAFKNRAVLEKEYSRHIIEHDDNHYGTFEQFKDLVKAISGKAGFYATIDGMFITLWSSSGKELDFHVSGFGAITGAYIVHVTTEWKEKVPDKKELVWQVMPDGSKLLLPNIKTTKIRVFERFVFASIQDYIQFRYWMHNASKNNALFNVTNEEKELMSRKQKDINANYWLLSADNKKIHNMKDEEVDKLLELDKFEKEFAKLPKVAQDLKLLSGGK